MQARKGLSGHCAASAMDAVVAIDEKQRIIVFNPASEKMFGCTVNEAIGSDLDRFIPQGFCASGIRRFKPHNGCIGRKIFGSPREQKARLPIEASISQEETKSKGATNSPISSGYH